MNRTQQLFMALGMSLLWVMSPISSAVSAPGEAAPATAKVTAKPTAAAHRAKVEEALGLYGVKDQLAQVPALLEAQMAQKKGEIDPELHGQLTGILVDSYQGETLYAHVLRYFETHAEPAQVEEALAWLNSPLSKKMTEFEVEAATPEGQQQLQQFAAGLGSNLPSDARVALVMRLDEATRATDLSVNMLASVTRAMIEGTQPLLPPGKKISEEDLEMQIEYMKAALKPTLKSTILISFLYTYRAASDEELEQYAGYWESESGQWLNRITGEAWLEAMSAAGREAGGRIAEISSRKSLTRL